MQLTEKLDFNPSFKQALDLLETSNKHLFITGNAGTGKSTLLQYFRRSTQKNVAVLAPTGVAAVNVQGQTIHSFFNFKPDITPEAAKSVRLRKGQRDIYKKLHTLIIDEISMVRSDLLDCIDVFLRKYSLRKDKPFGGVQMVFIGDLFQLPPVVTRADQELFKEHYSSPFFFDAKAFEGLDFEYIELEKIYRQDDKDFIHLLNAIRNNEATGKHLYQLQERFQPEFVPDEDGFFIYLTTTNKLADFVNKEQLARLTAKPFSFAGQVEGEFQEKSFPTQYDLDIKIGAQVMMLNNDSLGRWINGSIGRVEDVVLDEDDNDVIVVTLDNGLEVDVTPHTWEAIQYSIDEEDEEHPVKSHVVGTFKQYPLKLAWAVTIHKSQGKTFDHVILDIGTGTFAHGQLYVALSRCRTLEGLILRKPIHKQHIIIDPRVLAFTRRLKEQIPVLK